MESSTLPRLGLFGLGLMGSAIAVRAAQSGFSILGYDILPEQNQAFEHEGHLTATSPKEVVDSSDWLVFSVMTTDQVRATLTQCEAHLRRGQVVIDCSTGEPDTMAELGAWLAAREVDYLDATIAGNSAETRDGNVLLLVGGATKPLERCQPFFRSFAKKTFHIGPQGYGARMKLVFNLVLGLHRAVLGEALGFADKLGIDRKTTLEILKTGTAYSYVMENKGTKILSEDFSPQAKLQQHLKDVNLMMAMGERYGAKLPLSKEHQRLLSELNDRGMGVLDNCAIVKAFE